MRELTPRQVQEFLQQADTKPLLLDVRESWEYDICHIEGSTLLPMSQISEQLETLDKTQEIILICHHGMRSRQVGVYLSGNGFDKLINLQGGIEAWAQEVEPTMPHY